MTTSTQHEPKWVEPRWEYRDGRVVCFDHLQRAYTHGANPKHFTKVAGTPPCALCEPARMEEVK